METLNRNATAAVEKAVSPTNEAMNQAISKAVADMLTQMKAEMVAQIKKHFYAQDFNLLVREVIAMELEHRIHDVKFPDKSIPISSIDTTELTVPADNITGGIIRDFASTGIEDKANFPELTVMDGMVVAENRIVAKELDIKGDAIISGNLVLRGEIPISSAGFTKLVDAAANKVQAEFTPTLVSDLGRSVDQRLRQSGIDVAKILVNGRKLFDEDGSLTPYVRKSKLTTVGELEELQVSGEALLSGSLYTTAKRVGINTIEPSAALAVWDEETEMVMAKRKAQTGYIGSVRIQDVVLGANSQENIVLKTDGSTTIKNLTIDNTKIHSTKDEPQFAGDVGDIAFNKNPIIGQPWGWICLGGSRWGTMGEVR